jgi:hypothetical protein
MSFEIKDDWELFGKRVYISNKFQKKFAICIRKLHIDSSNLNIIQTLKDNYVSKYKISFM